MSAKPEPFWIASIAAGGAPRLRNPGESVEDYRVAMGWDQPKISAQAKLASTLNLQLRRLTLDELCEVAPDTMKSQAERIQHKFCEVNGLPAPDHSCGVAAVAPAQPPHTHAEYADGFDDGKDLALNVVAAKRVSLSRADTTVRITYANLADANAAFDVIMNTGSLMDELAHRDAAGATPAATAHLSEYEDEVGTGNESVTPAQINAGPHAGLGTAPSDYAAGAPAVAALRTGSWKAADGSSVLVGPPWCCEKGEALNAQICPECGEACAAYSAAAGVGGDAK